MKRKALYGLMALSLGVAPAAWAELPRYMIKDLGDLKPELKGYGDAIAVAINNKGQILGSAPISITYDSVGNVEAETHTFLYSKGRMKDLVEELGGSYNGYNFGFGAINNRGDLAGSYGESSSSHPLLFSNGNFVDLSSIVGDVPNDVVAINDKSQVAIALAQQPFNGYWTSGKVVDKNNKVYSIPFAPAAINNKSKVAGSLYKPTSEGMQPLAYRYCYKTKKLTNLLGRGNYGLAYDINDKNQVVGGRYVPGPDQSKVLQAYLHDGKKVIDIGALPAWPDLTSIATDINNKGQVVGSAYTEIPYDEGSESHAFVYDTTNGVMDLNDLIVNKAGWDFMDYPRDINDKGRIVGSAIPTRMGGKRAVLLTPVGPAVNVNDAVAVQIRDVSLLPARSVCPINYAAEGTFKVRLTNNGTQTLTALELDFAQSTNIQFLAYGDWYKVDERLGLGTLENNRYRDGKLSPGESIKVSFTACLKENKPFTVAADVWAAKTK